MSKKKKKTTTTNKFIHLGFFRILTVILVKWYLIKRVKQVLWVGHEHNMFIKWVNSIKSNMTETR